MKKVIFGVLLFIFLIPTSVRASGVVDFSSVVSAISYKTGFWPQLRQGYDGHASQNDNEEDMGEIQKVEGKDEIPCEFGFRFDYREERCGQVVVPEHGVLNSDGISVRCEVGYKLEWTVASGQCIAVKIPAHASLSGAGDDFQCDRDYKRVGEVCEKVIIPSNGHLAAGGNDFDCNTGFTKRVKGLGERGKDDGECVNAELPVHAKFFPNSDDWYCEAGFSISEDGKSCEALIVPAHGRRSETGTFFYCEQGYKSVVSSGQWSVDRCEKVSYPENAEPNWIGGWDCNQGYTRVGDRCEKVEAVEHGKFFTRGADFYCEPTYRKDEENRTCVKIDLPQNAEWDEASYGGWRCKQGYVKNLGSNSCDVFRLPEHAFWVGFNSWDCDPGYKKKVTSGQLTVGSCEKITIPEHAHPSSSYDRWDCDSGYSKNYKENRCDTT